MVTESLDEKTLMEFWTEFVNWEKRRQGEDGFFARQLRAHGCRSVFDVGCGDGFDAIELAKRGFEVTANEINQVFKEEAKRNARVQGVDIAFTPGYDWRDLAQNLSGALFDAVLCVGNSLTYMMTRYDQDIALYNFSSILKQGGVLIVDHRNYDYMLGDRRSILENPHKNFKFSRKFYYCGETIDGYPIKIEDDWVVMEYFHKTS